MLRSFWLYLSLFISALWVCGCGSSDNILLDAQGNQIQSLSSQFVLKSNVKELPDDNSVIVVEITDGTVVLSGNVPALSVGDTVIKNEGEQQFLRKVISLSSGGGRVTIQTGPAVLTDVFESADIRETINIGPELLKELQPALPGVTFGQPEQIRPRGEELAAWGLPVHFGDAVLGSNGQGSLVGNGDITIRLALYKDLQIGVRHFVVPTVNHFALVPKVTVEGNLKVTGTGSGDFSAEFPLTGKFNYDLVGFAGVGINLSGQLMVGIDGYIQAASELQMSGRVALEAGIEANQDQWSTVSNFEKDFSITPPAMGANARLNVNLLAPRLALNLLGMGSAWVDSNLLRLECEAAFKSSPSPQYEVVVYRTFSIDAGAHLTLGISPLAVSYDAVFPVFNGSREEVARLGTPIPNDKPVTLFVVLAPATVDLKPGQSQLLLPFPFVMISPVVIVPIPQPCVFQSSNSSIARVRSYGFFALVEAVAGGDAVITATAPNGVASVAQAHVSSAGLLSLELRAGGVLTAGKILADGFSGQVLQNNQLSERGGRRFQAIGHYADGSERDLSYAVSWNVDNSNSGQANRAGDVRARGQGQFNLSVQSPMGKSVTSQVQVVRPRASALLIGPLFPHVATLAAGQPLQLQAAGWYPDGSLRLITDLVEWKSGDPATATVSHGLVTPVAGGEVLIQAYDPESNLLAEKPIQVGGPMTGLRVSPGNLTRFGQGSSCTFRAFASYASAGEREVSSKVRWTINNDSLGVPDAAGKVVFSGVGTGKVCAFFNGRTASTAEFEVRGPAGLRFAQQPTTVQPGQSFAAAVEVVDTANQVFTGPMTVNLELGGGPGNANLTGTLTRQAAGTANFTGLSIDQLGSGYFLRAFAYGLSVINSDFFQVGGAGGSSPGFLILSDRGANTGVSGLRSIAIQGNGDLGTSSTQNTSGRPDGLVRLGNFVFVANTSGAVSNSLDTFSYSPTTGALGFLTNSGANSVGATPGQPLALETNGSDALFALAQFDNVLVTAKVNTGNGQVAVTDSVALPLAGFFSGPRGVTFHDVPGSTNDYVFVADEGNNAVHVVRYDSVTGALAPVVNSPFVNGLAAGPGSGGGPLATRLVGDHLFAINPSGNKVSTFAFDSNTGQLTAVAGGTATGTSPSSIFSVDNYLYVGNQADGTISGYSVGAGGSLTPLSGGVATAVGDINPRTFVDVAIDASNRVLYVATSTKVAALMISADGSLSPLGSSPFTGYGSSPGVVRF
ncbi:beta-propeller fold lactonase family protein [bacterium]|nr:beta-propeller fold lactonase family protein [bacterium]